MRWVCLLSISVLVAGGADASAWPQRATRAPSAARPASRLVRQKQKPGGSKPTAPVAIELIPGRAVGVAAQEARIVVRPSVNAARVDVKVTASDGLALIRGRSRLAAAARSGAATAQTVTLGYRGRGTGRLLIVATLTFADGRTATGYASYTLNPQAASPTAGLPGAREVVTPEGRRLMEIPIGGK